MALPTPEPIDVPPRRTTRRRIALTVTVVIVLAVGWLIADVVKLAHPGKLDPRAYFRDHRSDLERVARLVDEHRLVATEREQYAYGPKLPADLRYLSDTERVSTYDDGSLYIPLWTGIPDDSGGLWHQEQSPQGNDMYGLACYHPRRLAPNWWACGMKGVRAWKWSWVWW